MEVQPFRPRWLKRQVPSLALLMVALLWGSSLVVVKDTTASLRPNFLLACRFTLASFVLAPFCFSSLRRCTRKEWRSGSIIGFCLFLAYSSQTVGVTYAPAGRSAFLSATYCILVPFVNWAITARRPTRHQIVAALLCFAGVALVAQGQQGDSLGGAISIGDGLALLSGLLFATHIVAVDHWGRGIDSLTVTVLQFIVAAVLAWGVSFLGEDWSGQNFGGGAVVGIVYLSLFCTAAALFMQNWGQKAVPPAASAILLGLESVFGVLFSWWFHGEIITGLAMTGFTMIFFAIMVAELAPARGRKKKDELVL